MKRGGVLPALPTFVWLTNQAARNRRNVGEHKIKAPSLRHVLPIFTSPPAVPFPPAVNTVIPLDSLCFAR